MEDTTPRAELVFTIEAHCGAPVTIGTIDGGLSRMIPITGGSVSGAELDGKVLPGADWSIVRHGGLATVEARYALQATDGTIIQIWNSGTDNISRETMRGPVAMITSPRFLAPEGPHDWLNRGVYVATLMPDLTGASGIVRIGIYRMR